MMEGLSPLTRPRLTRIAPTPSGYLHAGNVASFVLTVGLARQWGAEVLLRIDDMDRERFRREYLEDVFGTLRFLGIPWDRGPRDAEDFEAHWSQSHRLDVYEGHLRRLAEGGQVFACHCSRTELSVSGPAHPAACLSAGHPLSIEGAAWRLSPVSGIRLRYHSVGAGWEESDLPVGMAPAVVRRKDGIPAYHLCSVADDVHFGVDAVVRGADLFESTLLQLHLAGLLGLRAFTDAAFLHHPLLVGAGGEKLSKSAGSGSIMDMRRKGMRPWEVYRSIAGWISPGADAGDFEGLFSLLKGVWSDGGRRPPVAESSLR
jgi:glutamyl/glutaminyl-tRNA synthetase